MLFLVSIGVMGLAGWGAHNQDLLQHGKGTVDLITYLRSGDFVSAETGPH